MTTQQSIQAAIDEDRDRTARIENLMSTMPPHHVKRLEEAQRQLSLGLARAYGTRLNEHVANRIVEGLILDPECLCSISGGVNELPTSRAGWTDYSRKAAAGEPLAKLSIDASDATLKEELRATELQSMRPDRRIQMARSGELDAHLNAMVKSKIEARAGV